MRKSNQLIVTIDECGCVETLGNPLGLPGVSSSTRYSEIVPINRVLRVAFRALRKMFGDHGIVAGFTRRWPCDWQATILSTGRTARSNCRETLIAWEHSEYFKPFCDL